MPSVSDLVLKLQTGTDNKYFATWDFKESAKKDSGGSSTSTIKKGDWVTIKSGASYYNGVSIPSWVMAETWKVIQVTNGDRAVLGPNKTGAYDIQSAISTKHLTTGSSSGSSGSSSTQEEVVKYLDYYLVKWYYATGDGIWFVSNDSGSQVESKQATYTRPSNATKVKISVKPVSKTKKVNDKEVSYWTGEWVSKTIEVAGEPPETPPKPSVETEKYQLTATIDGITDSRTDQVEFELWRRKNGDNLMKYSWYTTSYKINVRNCRAAWTMNITAGDDFIVRCRAINLYNGSSIYSEWSEYSDEARAIPSVPKQVTVKALSETSVQVSWLAVASATGYEVEYTTKKIYFDAASNKVESVTVTDTTDHAIITGMTSGEEYFFRVRASNDSGDSGWSEIKSIVIGEPPAAPTTWSSTTTAITGKSVNLYWVHNTKDESNQTYAQLELYDSETKNTVLYTFDNKAYDSDTLSYTPLSEDEQDEGKINSCILKTDLYNEGTTILWRVRTAGITKEYGDWSVQRTIDVYAPATLELSVTDTIDGELIETLSSFPFYISALAGPDTQAPIGYHVSIISNEQYETVDNMGNPKIVNSGEAVYSKYFDISTPLLLEMTPSVISLKNNISYTVSCIVSMNSGLTTEASLPLNVSWTVLAYEPDAEIGINPNDYSAYISPYCLDADGNTITDVSLSVYRREFDGSFTEIATGIETDANEYILDPHPSLDYARYRIIATSKTTGSVSYYDPPGYPIGGKEVIVQWDEEWKNFNATEEDMLETSPWSGSMLKLPYNIDVSESNSSDVSLIEYAGRQHPVSYYGTHLGVSANWSVEIPKTDKETIYALRRLARWMGDVYVREPSGVGYWANISVSFSQKHCEVTIPVTLNISQVEGGV